MMDNVCASNEPMVVKVLERRYSISMERGQLIINQSDGTPVAKSWIKSHQASKQPDKTTDKCNKTHKQT